MYAVLNYSDNTYVKLNEAGKLFIYKKWACVPFTAIH